MGWAVHWEVGWTTVRAVKRDTTGAHCRCTHRTAPQVAKFQMSNNNLDGSSSASLIATRPSTASRPSMMRWSYDIAR